MNRFSEGSTRRLTEAGDEVLSLVEHDGMHPTQAIVKVARDRRVPETWLPLLVSGYNIAASAQQRESPDPQDSVLEKIAEFPLARIEDVRAALYPDSVESPSSSHHKTAVAADWTSAPRPPRPRKKPTAVKSAAAPARPTAAEPTDAQLLAKIAEADRQLRETHLEFENAVGDLARYFRLPGTTIDFQTWEHGAVCKYAEAGRAIADKVHALANIGLRKIARYEGRPTYRPLPPDSPPMTALSAAIEAAERLLDIGSEKIAAEQAIARRRHERETPSLLRDDALSLWDGDVEIPQDKLAGVFGDIMGGVVGGSLAGDVKEKLFQPEDTMRQQMRAKLQPVAQQKKLLGANTDFVLRDLRHNDEVISHAQPDDIAQAYNELTSIAPIAMQQPAVVKTMLRKRLSASVLDPIDLDQLVSLEQKLKKNQNPQQTRGTDV